MFRTVAKKANLNSDKLLSYSLRVGGSTAFYAHGGEEAAQAAGNWRSLSSHLYTWVNEQHRDDACLAVGRQSLAGTTQRRKRGGASRDHTRATLGGQVGGTCDPQRGGGGHASLQ